VVLRDGGEQRRRTAITVRHSYSTSTAHNIIYSAKSQGVVDTTTYTGPAATFGPVISAVNSTLTQGPPGMTTSIAATDPAGRPITYTTNTGTFSANPDGTYTLTPTTPTGHILSFDLTADDGVSTTTTTVHTGYLTGTSVSNGTLRVTVTSGAAPVSALDATGHPLTLLVDPRERHFRSKIDTCKVPLHGQHPG
jgi:hypothetical protein